MEEAYFWRYRNNPADLCSFKICRSRFFRRPIQVYTTASGKPICLRHDIFFLGADISDQIFSDGTTIAQTLASWCYGTSSPGQIACFLLAEQLVHLWWHGQWSTICTEASRSIERRGFGRPLVGCRGQVQRFWDLLKSAPDTYPFQHGVPVNLGAVSRIADRLRTWAPIILDHYGHRDLDREDEDEHGIQLMRLRDSVQLLESLQESLHSGMSRQRGVGYRGPRHDTKRLLACMRLMMEIRNRNKLPTVVARALEASLPGLAGDLGKEERLASVLPSKTTLSRNQCALDAAMLMLQSQELFEEEHCIYILADSSPQLSYNLFLSMMQLIPLSKLVTCFKAASQLCLLQYRGLSAGEEDKDDVLATLRRRVELTKVIQDCIIWMVNMPACLGAGSTSVATKVRLILHVFWMLGQPPRLACVARLVNMVVAFTTDMGVEIGMSDFEACSLRSVMPPWMFPSQHGRRVMDEDDGCLDEEEPEVCDPVEDKRFIFPDSLVIPGVLHIVHNLSWKADKAMPNFDSWLNGLKAVVTLLHYKQNRELFVERCVRGTPFDHIRSPLRSGVPSTAEWRWASIVLVLKALLPLRVLLRCTFDAAKMREQAEDEEDEREEGPAKAREGKLDPALIQTTVRDTKWWAFSEMMWSLHKVLMDFQGWIESCACHWPLRALKGAKINSVNNT